MARNGVELLMLQGNIKRDPEGYTDEFQLQLRHYHACLDIFKMKPSKESREFSELVGFISQVVGCYPKETEGFAAELMQLLDTHYAVLDSGLRQTLVKALILMRNRGQVEALELLPLFIRLFRCPDKALRRLLFRHIIADVKGANQRQRNDRLNRALQNFLYGCLGAEGEAGAKPALAVLTELWRRQVWRDARTVNVIASAAFNESSRVALAAVKFFLGQDEAPGAGSDDEDDDPEERVAGPSKAELYAAHKKGTASSKKKKQAKLKRVMHTVKKQARRERAVGAEGFAAIQLLHDPQTFAEKLFARLQRSGGERFEARLAMAALVSRVVGVHRLLLVNFYPFLQRYLQPHQRDVTQLLAALVQACHEMVPPEVLAPVLRQLVDAFVHDRARPEVMTLGLKTVRELCVRSPLVMTPELLQDLALYKKFRNKEVASAARGVIGLFRELAPALLEKRDRGRGADVTVTPLAYGAAAVSARIPGAELLQAAEAREAAGLASEDEGVGSDDGEDHDPNPTSGADGAGVPLEHGRILSAEDFARMRELRHKAMVSAAMRKHGLKSASKRGRLLAAAEEEADEALAAQDARATAADRRVDPAALEGRHKGRANKEERLARVHEGREGRDFGAAAARKKQKTGGTSNKQKAKRKNMPLAARAAAVRKRTGGARKGGKGGGKQFRGRAKGVR
ncbi:hypothetical protein WJX81_003203 [Elliptochloris bilobata]|uniref:Protein SDA1 n=1 Tax=Elliptochloris bilobata TaxID=381761 RepID=A0AAW1RM73_9CHLO